MVGRHTSSTEDAAPAGGSEAVASRQDVEPNATAPGSGAVDPGAEQRALLRALSDPSFNPRKRDAGVLFDWLGGDNSARARDAVRALARFGDWAAGEADLRLGDAQPPARARLVSLLARTAKVSSEPKWVERLAELLEDDDGRARREAAIGLGKLSADHPGRAVAEAALLAAWRGRQDPAQRRAIAAALGKVGAVGAMAALREGGAVAEDPALGRIVREAQAKLERTRARTEPGRIDPRRTALQPVAVLLHCRAGLEPLLVEELGATAGARVVGPGRVRLQLTGSLEPIVACRTMLRFTFPLPPQRIADPSELSRAVADALCSPESLALLRGWTVGPIRYRIEWRDGGHRRGAIWQCAALVSERCPELSNDPTASLWQLNVSEVVRGGETTLWCELWPRGLEDRRFGYRVRDLPAASHPTIAAALVWLGGVRDDDVVWDPFVGSGTELVERAFLGPYRRLLGSDLEPDALAAARENLRAAGIDGVELRLGDATELRPPEAPTLIISNPPMGRRLLDRVVVGPLLDRFVHHAGALLAPRGRLVWISPLPERTYEAATRARLYTAERIAVDLGGIAAEIQRFERR